MGMHQYLSCSRYAELVLKIRLNISILLPGWTRPAPLSTT